MNNKQINKKDKIFDNSILGKSKLEKDCNYKQEQYSPLAYQKFEREPKSILTTKSSIVQMLKQNYLFNDYEEFKSYFIKHVVIDINHELLDL